MDVEWKISDALVPYPEAIDIMEQRVENIFKNQASEMVWCLEHPPLYTAGTSAKPKDLIDKKRFPIYQTGRGGEYTYHGPGQRIVYIMLDLNKRMQTLDLRAYIHTLEQWIIDSLQHIDIKGERRKDRIGIWVKNNNTEAKIAALGIRIRRGITYHGIAINLNPNLEHFSGIIPCGIKEYGVTSIEQFDKNITMDKLDNILQQEFSNLFKL